MVKSKNSSGPISQVLRAQVAGLPPVMCAHQSQESLPFARMLPLRGVPIYFTAFIYRFTIIFAFSQ